MVEQNKFDLVDKYCFEIDPYHAPFETIIANNRNQAKYKYLKLYPEYNYKDILCRKHKKESFNII